MFEGQPLSEVTYGELLEFLREGNEEGTRLDHEREWDSGLWRVACSTFRCLPTNATR